MFAAAENLEFEKAARLRDQLRVLKGELEPGGDEASQRSEDEAARGGKRPAAKASARGGRGRRR